MIFLRLFLKGNAGFQQLSNVLKARFGLCCLSYSIDSTFSNQPNQTRFPANPGTRTKQKLVFPHLARTGHMLLPRVLVTSSSILRLLWLARFYEPEELSELRMLLHVVSPRTLQGIRYSNQWPVKYQYKVNKYKRQKLLSKLWWSAVLVSLHKRVIKIDHTGSNRLQSSSTICLTTSTTRTLLFCIILTFFPVQIILF